MTVISPYIRQTLRTPEQAAQDIAEKRDSRVLWDDDPVDMRCRVPLCHTPLRMAQERAYRICMGCQKERA